MCMGDPAIADIYHNLNKIQYFCFWNRINLVFTNLSLSLYIYIYLDFLSTGSDEHPVGCPKINKYYDNTVKSSLRLHF